MYKHFRSNLLLKNSLRKLFLRSWNITVNFSLQDAGTSSDHLLLNKPLWLWYMLTNQHPLPVPLLPQPDLKLTHRRVKQFACMHACDLLMVHLTGYELLHKPYWKHESASSLLMLLTLSSKSIRRPPSI